MPIERGQDWGSIAPPGLKYVVAGTDAQIRTIVEAAWAAGDEVPPIAVVGGDLWRALGAPAGGTERIQNNQARMLQIDAARLQIGEHVFASVAHVFCLRSWWAGPIMALMNSEWRTTWRIAPKAHPNDGLLDLLEADLPIGQRWLARKRLRTGDHLPHRLIHTERVTELNRSFERPRRIYIDGVDEGRHQSIAVTVIPDAFRVIL